MAHEDRISNRTITVRASSRSCAREHEAPQRFEWTPGVSQNHCNVSTPEVQRFDDLVRRWAHTNYANRPRSRSNCRDRLCVAQCAPVPRSLMQQETSPWARQTDLQLLRSTSNRPAVHLRLRARDRDRAFAGCVVNLSEWCLYGCMKRGKRASNACVRKRLWIKSGCSLHGSDRLGSTCASERRCEGE